MTDQRILTRDEATALIHARDIDEGEFERTPFKDDHARGEAALDSAYAKLQAGTGMAVDALATSAHYLMVNAHGVAADLLHPQKLSRELREEMFEVLELYVKEVREALEGVEPWTPTEPSRVG